MAKINDPDGLSQGGVTNVAATTFASASGAQIVITSANVPAVTAGDFIEVRDALTAANNGLYEVDSYSAGTSITATKQALTGSVVNPANDATSQAIRVLGKDSDEKNVYFDTANKKITLLNGFGSVTQMTNEGVVGQAFYSFCKEEWKNDNDLLKFDYPMESITDEQFEFIKDWAPVDEDESTISTTDPSNTRQLLRTMGWDEVNTAGLILNSFFGVVTLGNIEAANTAYYFFDSFTAASAFTFAGPVDEAVQTVVGIGNPTDCEFASTSTITRSAGSFVTDGFLAGDRVFIQNADTAGNNGSFVITNVAATTLIVSGTPFTAETDANALLAIDRRQNVFTCRIRTFGQTYDQSTTTAIGVTTIRNKVERFPLSEANDAVVQDLVTTTIGDLFDDIITTPIAPYDDMTIAYFASPQTRSGFNPLGGDTPSAGDTQFGVIIDADVSEAQEDGGGVATAEQIYAFAAAKLVGTTDINDGSGGAAVVVPGQLAELLLSLASTGNTMYSLAQVSNPGGDGTGVYVDTFKSTDKNRVSFVDNDGDARTFPFVATGSILFNANLSTDTDAVYRMFFTNDDAGDNNGYDFGTIDAITVQNASSVNIAGAVPQQAGGSSVSFDFDYDGNDQRGTGSEGEDAPITIVAIGLSTAQYVIATGTITRAENQTFSLVAALERNFSNP